MSNSARWDLALHVYSTKYALWTHSPNRQHQIRRLRCEVGGGGCLPASRRLVPESGSVTVYQLGHPCQPPPHRHGAWGDLSGHRTVPPSPRRAPLHAWWATNATKHRGRADETGWLGRCPGRPAALFVERRRSQCPPGRSLLTDGVFSEDKAADKRLCGVPGRQPMPFLCRLIGSWQDGCSEATSAGLRFDLHWLAPDKHRSAMSRTRVASRNLLRAIADVETK